MPNTYFLLKLSEVSKSTVALTNYAQFYSVLLWEFLPSGTQSEEAITLWVMLFSSKGWALKAQNQN